MVLGLLAVDVGVVREAGAQSEGRADREESAGVLPVEAGVVGDPGALESEPRDFDAEFAGSDGSDAGGLVGRAADGGGVRELKRVREVVERRSEATETFELEDGSMVTDVSLVPKWYRDAKGAWQRVNVRIVEDGDRKGGLRTDGVGWSVTFGSVGDGLVYEIEGKRFSARFVDGADARVLPERDKADGMVVWYRNVWPGVDVSYRVSASAVKEDFHVGSVEALRGAGVFATEWTSSGRLVGDPMLEGGLRLDWDGDGDVAASEPGPKVSIEPVRVFDASGAVLSKAQGRLGVDFGAEERIVGRERAEEATSRRIGVELDGAWVESLSEESFPLVIDPTVNLSPSSGGGWASYGAQGNSIGTSQYPLLGDGMPQWGATDEWRFGVYYDYSTIWTSNPGARVRYSDIQFDTVQYPLPVGVFNSNPSTIFYNGYYPSSPNASAAGACHANAWSFAGTWMGVSPTLCRNYGMTLNGPQYAFLGAHPSTAWTEVSQLLRPWVDSQTPNAVFGVKIDTTPGYTFHAVLPTLRVWWDRQSTVPALTAPVGDATITSLTPTLSWGASTDPDAGENPPNYEVVLMGNKPATTPGDAFELSGCSAGATRVWSSGYGSATSAVVPAGLLNDGASYYWAVAAIGGGGIDRFPRCSEVRKFTVNRRLGVSGPFPVEQLGPVGVNVINGNVVIGASTHSYATVGGEQSLSLVYNSQATNDRGLRGRYYGGKYPLFGAEIDVWNGSGALFVDRLDPTVDFAWGSGSPVTTMDAMDDFRVTWSGYVTPGVAGTYCFGGTFDEGVKITINGVVVLNKWQHQSATFNCSNGGTAVVFGAGETKSIVVDYYEHTGAATAQLRVTKPDNSTVAVPSSWLSPDLDVLGPNWTLSAGEVAVQGAIKTDSGVMLRGVDGSATEYRKSDTGAYVGPGGDGTVVRVDPTTSEISVMDDAGTSYKFSASGQLQSAVSAVDDRQPAATQFQWSGAPVKLTAMVDPVTGSQSVLRYGGDANCPSVPSGFVSAPSKLCSVTSPDGRQTKLFYDASARLSRLVTPGDVTTDFAYDSSNRIIKVRDPVPTSTRCPRGNVPMVTR